MVCLQVKRRVENQQAAGTSPRSVNLANYNVEFMSHKLREDKDKSGNAVVGGSSGLPYDKIPEAGSESGGPTIPEDEWVWLTSHSRIQVSLIKRNCRLFQLLQRLTRGEVLRLKTSSSNFLRFFAHYIYLFYLYKFLLLAKFQPSLILSSYLACISTFFSN